MGDMAEGFRAMTRERKERHRRWMAENSIKIGEAFADGRLPGWMSSNQECLMFRQTGWPKADFYPSTGRWRSEGKTYRGHAEAFIAWMNKRKR